MNRLTAKFAFLPPLEAIDIPSGWFALLAETCRRLGAVVPKAEWGQSFRITSLAVKDGALDLVTKGGNDAVEAVLRKTRRASMSICAECGTPGLIFPGKLGLRPRCPKCFHGPALLRELEEVLAWRVGIEGPGGSGIVESRIPPMLRPSFQQWLATSGLDRSQMQPWDLEGWLLGLGQAQKALRRTFS